MDVVTQRKWDKAAANFDLMAGFGPEKRWEPYKRELFANMGDGEILFIAVGTGLDIPFFPEGKKITGIDINTSAATSTPVTARIWYRRGSYFPATSTAMGWCLLANGTGNAAGLNVPTRLTLSGTATCFRCFKAASMAPTFMFTTFSPFEP